MISAHFLLLALATLLWFVAAVASFAGKSYAGGIGWLGLMFYGLALLVR